MFSKWKINRELVFYASTLFATSRSTVSLPLQEKKDSSWSAHQTEKKKSKYPAEFYSGLPAEQIEMLYCLLWLVCAVSQKNLLFFCPVIDDLLLRK